MKSENLSTYRGLRITESIVPHCGNYNITLCNLSVVFTDKLLSSLFSNDQVIP